MLENYVKVIHNSSGGDLNAHIVVGGNLNNNVKLYSIKVKFNYMTGFLNKNTNHIPLENSDLYCIFIGNELSFMWK